MTKMQLTTDSQGYVTIEYDDEAEDARVTRTFTVRDAGGYVYECMKNGDRKQVCGHLSHYGSTLSASSRETLPALIRAEYRAMRRAEAAEARRYG